MNPYVWATLLSTLGLGTLMTFSSSHWLLAWMGLEINTLAIIPIMAQYHHPRAVEAAIKYFLTQATAAAVILFSTITNAWLTGQWEIEQMTHPLPVTLLTIGLALKLGLAPLHSWLPEVLQGLDLGTGLIVATWQKLAPLALLLQIHPSNSTLLIILGITSTLVGGWGGLNQTQLRKVMAYSSIAHLGWMILVLQFAPSLTLAALYIYLIMTASAFFIFKYCKCTNINSLAISWPKAPALTCLTPLVLLSLGGLPPLSGFLPKWMILQELAAQDLAITAVITALTALLSLYFYLRLSYAMALVLPPHITLAHMSWRFTPTRMKMHLALTTTSTAMLLPLTPALMALLKR
uniref:NADH-ubiquinone oxidoreductase chain 2 n=1 Tax=Gerres decacanthus TaxID=581038 RepID=A0A6M4DUF4_9TELE|nr:NADH dehydrogenase subunit 2 [Gerres decacanthus]